MCIKFFKLHKNKASSTVYSLITMLFASVVFLLSYKVYLNAISYENDMGYKENNISCDIEKLISIANKYFNNEENKNKILNIKNNEISEFSIDEHIISIKYIGYKYYLQDYNLERNNFVEIEIKHVNNNLILIPKSKCEKIYNF